MIAAIEFNSVQIPVWQQQVATSLRELQTNYPADLIIAWDMQQLNMTPSEPLAIQYPSHLTVNGDVFPPLLAFLYPHDVAEAEFVPLLPSRSLAVVTPTTLFINQTSGGWNQLPLSSLPGFEQPFALNQQNLPDYITRWQSSSDSVLAVVAGASWFFWPVSLVVSRLWLSVFDGLLLYVLLQFNRLYLPIKKVWQLVIHVLITASVVELIASWIYPQLDLPLLTITTWVVLIYFVLSLRLRQRIFLTITDQK